MTETASLTIKVDSSGARRATDDLDKLGRESGKAERATDRLTRAWQGARRALGALGIANIATASGVMALVTSTSKAIEQTGLMAQQIGTTTESLSEMRYAAQQMANVSEGQFDMALRRMTRRITEAAAGGGPAADAIKRLGLEATALARLAPDEQFKRVADAMRAMDDQGERLRTTMALMDTEGMPLVNMLSEGAEGIEQFTAKAREMGLTISTDTVQAAQEFNRKLDDVKSTMRGVWLEASSDLLPTLTELADLLQSDGFKQGFQSIIQGAMTATTWLANFATTTASVTQFLAEEFAARRHGAALDNTVRVEDELSRIEQRIGRIQRWQERGRIGQAVTGLGKVDPFAASRDRSLMAPRGGSAEEKAERELNILLERQAQLREALANPPAPTAYTPPELADSPTFKPDVIIDRTEAVKAATEADKEWAEWMAEVEAHEQYATESLRAHNNEIYRRANAEEDARERAVQRVDAMIEQMQFEHYLLGLTNEEQEKAIALRYAGADATDEQREAIERWMDKMARAREARSDLDFMEDGARNLFRTVVTDSQRASDALNRFFDNLKARAADRIFDALLKGFSGMAGGGGWAGFAQGFAGAFTGGGRAAGGPVMAGQGYVVGEHGPELFTPPQTGHVHPMGRSGMGGTPVVNLTVHGAPSQPQTRVTPNGTGGFDMEMIFKQIEGRMAESLAGGGRLAAAGKARFGWREQV